MEDEGPSPFFDSFTNHSFAVPTPIKHQWTLIREDRRIFRWGQDNEPFVLYMDEVETALGSLDGAVVRADASLTEFFYNKTEIAFADTRIVRRKFLVNFVGDSPFSFKPGLPFQGHLRVICH